MRANWAGKGNVGLVLQVASHKHEERAHDHVHLPTETTPWLKLSAFQCRVIASFAYLPGFSIEFAFQQRPCHHFMKRRHHGGA